MSSYSGCAALVHLVRPTNRPVSLWRSVLGVAEDELGERLLSALTHLEDVADEFTPDEALEGLDETTLQVFWRSWPQIGGWAGALWRRLNEDLAEPSRAPEDTEIDEVGGSG